MKPGFDTQYDVWQGDCQSALPEKLRKKRRQAGEADETVCPTSANT
jgi:hypothetical protein